ncbi:MAG: phosphate signaling complex protein PhoU [Lachnospira sp.]|nr:phosphate signaling complex protein PhoU [Lachnospira sp.]
MRLRFDEELNNLNREMILMGSMCEDAINTAIRALIKGDPDGHKKASAIVTEISHKEREIEDMCLKLLMQQQPVASDLRTISSALKMVSDLERIGDQSDDIAEIVSMQNISDADDKFEILDLGQAASRMVTGAVDAFVKRDEAAAREVIKEDDTVDDYFDKIKKELAKSIQTDEAGLEKTLDLLMISKYFERIGDHAVNIAQWVIFSITGVLEGNTK